MPNVLLARYFQRDGLFEGLDFTAMKEGRPDELFRALTVYLDAKDPEPLARFARPISCAFSFDSNKQNNALIALT